jgi:hypothetical protein
MAATNAKLIQNCFAFTFLPSMMRILSKLAESFFVAIASVISHIATSMPTDAD